MEEHAKDQEAEDHDVEIEVETAAEEVQRDIGEPHSYNNEMQHGAVVEAVGGGRRVRFQRVGFLRHRRFSGVLRGGSKGVDFDRDASRPQ